MSCVSPVTIHVNKQSYQVPCGRCLNCRIKKQSNLEFLMNKELLEVYNQGLGASFITLTYTDDTLPHNDKGYVTLRKKDLQDFHKRMRSCIKEAGLDVKYKHLSAGEYGDSLNRPHFHVVLLGISDVMAYQFTKKCWKYGLIDVGPLSNGGLRYVTKYCCKSDKDPEIKELDRLNNVESSFITHSVGLGKHWIETHLDEIVQGGYMYLSHGKRVPYPKYVCEYVMAKTGVDYSPALRDYFAKETLSVTKPLGINPQDYQKEKAILKERMLISSAQSKGIVVTPEFLASHHWVKPRTKRNYSDILSRFDFS